MIGESVQLRGKQASTMKKDTGNYTRPPSYPFIGLMAKLSRSYNTYAVLALLLMAFHLYTSLEIINDLINNGKERILSSCFELEALGDEIVIVPFSIATFINKTYATVGDVFSVNFLQFMMNVTNIFGEVLLFILKTYASVTLCVVKFIVDAAEALLLSQVVLIQKFIDGSIGTTRSIVNGAESGLETVVNGLEKADFLHIIPHSNQQISLTRLDQLPVQFNLTRTLMNIQLPSGQSLENLFSSFFLLPFNITAKAFIDSPIISHPDATLIFMSAPSPLNFCTKLDLEVMDQIKKYLFYVVYVLLGLIGCSILVFVGWESYLLTRHQTIFNSCAGEALSSTDFNHSTPLHLGTLNHIHFNLNSPWLSFYGKWFVSRITRDSQRQIRLRWLIDYCYHPPSFICILVGVYALVVSGAMLTAVDVVQSRYFPAMASTIQTFSAVITTDINQSINASSRGFIQGTNSAINVVEIGMNTVLNSPLNRTSEYVEALSVAIVNGTYKFMVETLKFDVLGVAFDEFYECLVASKLEMEHRLFDILHKIKVTLPRFKDTFFDISPQRVERMANKFSKNILGHVTAQHRYSNGILSNITDALERHARKEQAFGLFSLAFGLMVMAQGMVSFLFFHL